MNLKNTILKTMSFGKLRDAVEDLGLKVADRRERNLLEKALSKAGNADPALLVSYLNEKEVKDVCDRVGVESRGRRGTLIEVLLALLIKKKPDNKEMEKAHEATKKKGAASQGRRSGGTITKPEDQAKSTEMFDTDAGGADGDRLMTNGFDAFMKSLSGGGIPKSTKSHGESEVQSSPDPLTRDQTVVSGEEAAGKTTAGQAAESEVGALYIDFSRNADILQGPKNRSEQGLRDQLKYLHGRYKKIFFPDMPAGADILSLFKEAFFPNGFTKTYLVSNLSLEEGQPYLSIRPKDIGPRLVRILPRGMTMAVCGILESRGLDNPSFVVQKVKDLYCMDIRHYEREVTATVFCLPGATSSSTNRQKNVLTLEFVSSLPPISAETGSRLKEWYDYLDWKERMIRARMVGVRYLKYELTKDGYYKFLVISESETKFNCAKRIFRSNELQGYDLGYSTDPWEFKFKEKYFGQGYALGDLVAGDEAGRLTASDTEGMPWNSPFTAYIYFKLPDEQMNAFLAERDAGGDAREILSRYRGALPPTGFLSLSIVGEMALIRRQRSELDVLRQESGHAPFLSSYLFDIKTANVPCEILDIPDDLWLRTDLNEDQKEAVRLMVSAPDLALIQGPPGTGKTTMIAEATWQFVQQGKKVLLVSQANLAVDNVLERLSQSRAIRAIRLRGKGAARKALARQGEEENPYSQKKVLETYYGSIAKSCNESKLELWQAMDADSMTLAKWLKGADLVASDLNALREREEEVDRNIEAIRSAWERHLADGDRSASLSRAREDAEGFREFLEHDRSWKGELPDDVLRLFFDSIVRPIDELVGAGIRINEIWREYAYGGLPERSGYAAAILEKWRRLEKRIDHIKCDHDRLAEGDGISVLTPEDVMHLEDLNHREKKTLEEIDTGLDKVTELREIRKEIKELQRQGSGLDRDVYKDIFNVVENGMAVYAIVTRPGVERAQVVAFLEKVLASIRDVQGKVATGISQVSGKIREYIDGLVIPVVDPAEARRLEGQYRERSSHKQDLEARRASLESALVELMMNSPRVCEKPYDSALEYFPAIRESVARKLQEMEEGLERERPIRKDWETVLNQWVSDLSNPDTISSDQNNFLSKYIESCDVVGVTCTENRRTLEEAGHFRFDVVIVDEVSKATPPEIIMPLRMGKTAILVGDHRQLPPLFKEQEGSWEEALAAREEEETSGEEGNTDSELTAENFERFRKMVTSSLFKEHFENAPASLKAFLKTQYRMHPQIMRVVNHFYGNKLECGLTDPDANIPGSDLRGHRTHGMTLTGLHGQQYLTPDQHVIWLDSTTDPLGQKHFERQDGLTSRANDLEAILVAKSLWDIELACREQGYGQAGKARKQVGVITFYGRQIRVIREKVNRYLRFKNEELTAIRVDVSTVDRYQGQERPIVIVSMVRNPTWKLSKRANTAQFERINVAFSRAQELLVITGAKDVFCQYPVDLPYLEKPGRQKVEVYRFIIEEIQRDGGFWTSSGVIDAREYSGMVDGNGVSAKDRTNQPLRSR